MTTLALAAVWLHRNLFRQFMFPSCRFVPTCSEYAEQALQTHGLWRALWRIGWRLLRCQPLGGRGYDPVR